jgi:CubicO group peptidase (beta-lactamase class C family)
MPEISRRTAIKQIFAVSAAAALTPSMPAFGQRPNGRPTQPETQAMVALGRGFMQQFFAPALSAAIVWDSKFVFAHPWGSAYSKALEPCTPTSLFRIASVTKPITSVAIFTLVEQGKVNLNDKVFGPSGILGNSYSTGPYKQYVTDITVDNLLTHTCGGWPDDSTDPMFRFKSWDVQKLIAWTIENLPLTYPPGQHWAYSNFGYCVLGRVIEKITGQPYANYVQQAVLAPSGITDMQIAGNTLKERAPNEVEYLGQFGENPYGMNVRRMDSDAGWIANPSDLCRFVSHVGGSPTIPSILKPETIAIMTTPSPAYPPGPARYARGWMVRNDGVLWHNGSLPGSTSIIVKTPNGMCWAALTSTRSLPIENINQALDSMMWNMVRQVPGWNS